LINKVEVPCLCVASRRLLRQIAFQTLPRQVGFPIGCCRRPKRPQRGTAAIMSAEDNALCASESIRLGNPSQRSVSQPTAAEARSACAKVRTPTPAVSLSFGSITDGFALLWPWIVCVWLLSAVLAVDCCTWFHHLYGTMAVTYLSENISPTMLQRDVCDAAQRFRVGQDSACCGSGSGSGNKENQAPALAGGVLKPVDFAASPTTSLETSHADEQRFSLVRCSLVFLPGTHLTAPRLISHDKQCVPSH
jgi:hypothetical protein